MHERERQDGASALGRAPAPGRNTSAPGMSAHRAALAMASGGATPGTVAAVQRITGNSW